ncbi:MAG TPA: hypothetical protein VNG32_00165, partial [Candidatus Dormibacteraeota bacterium]|nr:hypothetical protein [Candidatus Dormibacteraeota bacterium]
MNKIIRLNERGVSQILIVILGVVVIGGVGFAGYKVANNHKASTANNVPAQSATNSNTAASSSCVAAYHDNNLCKFASNSTSLAKTAYTATLHAVQSGTASTMTLKNDGKGNTELSTT